MGNDVHPGQFVTGLEVERTTWAVGHGWKTLPLCWTDPAGNCACGRNHPRKSAGKAPLLRDVVTGATGDHALVRRWSKQWPQANWGVSCDLVTVLDIDDTELAESLKGDLPLMAEHLLVETPGRGGLHIYLKEAHPPRGTGNIVTIEGRRIGEVRRRGAYVVAPGSRIANREYRLLAKNQPAVVEDAEAWLGSVLEGFGVRLRLPTGSAQDSESEGPATTAETLLREAVARLGPKKGGRLIGLLEEGEKYTHLPSASERDFSAVCLLMEGGLTSSQVMAVWKQSPLGQRGKVQGRPDYISLTVARAYVATRRPSLGSFPSVGDTDVPTPAQPYFTQSWASLAQQNQPGVDWMVDGLIPPSATAAIAGPVGLGKTWLLPELARAVGTGTPWLGHFPTKQGCVLYIDEESSPSLLQRRLARLSKGAGTDAKPDVSFTWATGLDLGRPDSVAALKATIELIRPQMVIVDSLIRVLGVDENSATEVARSFQSVKDMVREFGVSFVFADHLRKPGPITMGPELMIRGSTDKGAFLDTILTLRRKDESLVLTHSKSRWAQPVQPFTVGIGDPDQYSTVVEYGEASEGLEERLQVGEAKEYILQLLVQGELSRKVVMQAVEEVGVAKARTAQKALNALVKEAKIIKDQRGREVFYHLPDPTGA